MRTWYCSSGAAFLLLLLVRAAVAQVPAVLWPLQGQGHVPSEEGRVPINVNVHLDRIIAVDQEAQTWRAIHRRVPPVLQCIGSWPLLHVAICC